MAAASLAAAIVVCCADPYAGSDLVGPAVEGGGEEGGDGGAAADALEIPPLDDAGALPDVQTVDGAGFDASGCLPSDCDCDKDTFSRASCNGSGVDAAVVDCDDSDPNRHPGQGFVASIPPPGQMPSGDWNCDGMILKAFPFGVVCSTISGLGGCASAKGFVGDPGCGVEGEFVQCQPGVAGLSCIEGTKTKRIQGCQ